MQKLVPWFCVSVCVRTLCIESGAFHMSDKLCSPEQHFQLALCPCPISPWWLPCPHHVCATLGTSLEVVVVSFDEWWMNKTQD